MESSKKNKNLWCLLIAGGRGTRLFPVSHDGCPKQFCPMNENETFIQATARRFHSCGVSPRRTIVIVTNENQRKLAVTQLAECEVLEQNIITIPDHLDFAGAMLYGTRHIQEICEDALVISTPVDQHIVDGGKFTQAYNDALAFVTDTGKVAIIGVKTTDLNTTTGCGHAKYDEEIETPTPPVIGFIEKPDLETAKQMLQDNNTACNTGITVWSAQAIMTVAEELKLLDRKLGTDELMGALLDRKILHVVSGKFVWEDCGTLGSLYKVGEKSARENVTLGKGTIYCEDSGVSGCLLIAPRKYILKGAGLNNVAVVINRIGDHTIIAVSALEKSQEIGRLAEILSTKDMVKITGWEGQNNTFSHFKVHDSSAAFIGVSNHTVAILDNLDGTITVMVSGNPAIN